MASKSTIHALSVVSVLTMLTGCSSGTPAPSSTVHVLQSGAGDGSGMASEVAGTLTIGNDGCAGIDGALTVWPSGTSWSDADDGLRLTSGQVIRRGAQVSGTGGQVSPATGRSAVVPADAASACDWSVAFVVLLNPGSTVF